jgi:hypothetical protein
MSLSSVILEEYTFSGSNIMKSDQGVRTVRAFGEKRTAGVITIRCELQVESECR